MFCSSQFLSTPSAVRSARPCKKNSAAKSYDVEKKKTAYLARAVMSAFGSAPRRRGSPVEEDSTQIVVD
jgi:hypothetical protein